MGQSTTSGVDASSSPAQKRLAYIIYDFSIKDGLTDNLIYAKSHFDGLAESPVRVEYPDPEDVRGQGEIWSDIVRPMLHEASHVIAYVDKPNANVGFEIGYALGAGNRAGAEPAVVALGLHATQVPDWLKRPPFAGFNAVRFETEKALISTIQNRTGFHLGDPISTGGDLFFLCPESGSKYLESANQAGQWRTLSGSGWALKELPKQLKGVGAIVWMIPPTVDERDGPENAALSVVAGFAKARNIELRVLLHKQAREVLDILPEAQQVKDLTAFNQLIRKTHDDLRRHIDESQRPPAVQAAVEAVPRPEVGDLPILPHTAEVTERFIGRQRWLEDFYLALEGLRARWMRALPGDRNPVQLFWYHGLGGMGKTTLVRRAMLETGGRFAEARVAYWEWDRDLWRKPLDRPPDSAEDLFVAVAWRLAQLYGVEALDPYWRVQARIASAAPQALQAKARFHNEHNDWVVKAQASSALRGALDALDLLRSKKPLSEPDRLRLFRRWIDQGGFELSDPEAALDGPRLQREALVSCLAKLSQQAPLLMVFDTCEVLSADAEQALRTLLVEICDRRKAVLVLIASRLAPDVGVTPGSKETWRDLLGDDRLKIERFDDLTLTTTEIEQYLERFDPTLKEPGELAQVLQRITLGVPLAVRVLVETEGGLDALRQELGAWNEQEDDTTTRESALYVLYERLADRFLLHVHDEDHLHAIIALAITTEANKDWLMTYWGGRNAWAERLRDLGRRYSLLSGGDLHPVVRGHLRRSLRAGKYPDETRTIAQALAEIAVRAPDTSSFDDRYFQHKLGRINLDTWTSADPSTLDIAAGLAVAMVHEQRLDNWFLLAAELAEATSHAPGRNVLLELQRLITVSGRNLSFRDFVPRYFWMTMLSTASLEACFEWLARAEREKPWSKEEKTALHIIRALKERDAPETLQRFAKAIEDAPKDQIPLVSQLGEALFDHALEAWRENPASAAVESSLLLAVRINYQASSAHAALGDFYRLGKEFEKARIHYADASGLEPSNAAHLVNLADLCRVQRQFDQAREWTTKALAIDANYVWAINQYGLIEKDLKRFDEAIAAFVKAHELEPTEPAFANNLADTYRLVKQLDKAREWVEKTLAIRSDYAWAHNQRGLIESELKHHGDAVEAFIKAHELDSTEPAFAVNVADAYRLLKQYDKAAEWATKASSIRPDYDSAYNQRGLIERDLKQYGEAIASFTKALELDPSEPVFANNLADTSRLLKQYDKANEWVDKTLAIRPDYAWAYNQRGLIESALKHHDQAFVAFAKAHELDPKEATFPHNAADEYRLLEQYDKAAEWVERALAIQADYASAYNQRGLIESDLEHHDQAIVEFAKAHELDPREASFPHNAADEYRLLKQYDKAAEWVERALAIQADYASAYNQRGLIASALKHHDQAFVAFVKAHELDPDDPAFPNNVADQYRLLKQYDKAAEWVEKTLAIQADYAWAYNQRGLIESALERRDQAVVAFAKAHELDPEEPTFPNNAADECRLLKQYDQAAEWVEKALAAQSDYAWAFNQRGLIESALEHHDRAIVAFAKAHELDPGQATFAKNAANEYRLLKQYDKAAEWVDRTLAIRADYASAYNQRGLIESALEHRDLAIAAFAKAHELDPDEASFPNNAADEYRLSRQYDKAAEWVEKTLAIKADYASAYNQRGLIETALEHYDEAIAAFTRAHELDPSDASSAYNVADTYRIQKSYENASQWVDKMLAVNPGYAWAYYLRGLIAEENRQHEAATAGYMQAYELDPSEPDFSFNVAWNLFQQLKVDDSERWVRIATDLDAEHAGVLNLAGALAFTRHRWSDAADIFIRTASLAPAEAILPCNAAKAFVRMGRFAEAEDQLAKALAINPDLGSANNVLALVRHLTDRSEAAELAERARTLDADFDSLIVCAITRARSAATTETDSTLEAFESALAAASPVDARQGIELVVYALSLLPPHQQARARELIRQNTSPVWDALRQAVGHDDATGVPQQPEVAAIVTALHSPLTPKEQLLASWSV